MMNTLLSSKLQERLFLGLGHQSIGPNWADKAELEEVLEPCHPGSSEEG